jgi:hypothetical protein
MNGETVTIGILVIIAAIIYLIQHNRFLYHRTKYFVIKYNIKNYTDLIIYDIRFKHITVDTHYDYFNESHLESFNFNLLNTSALKDNVLLSNLRNEYDLNFGYDIHISSHTKLKVEVPKRIENLKVFSEFLQIYSEIELTLQTERRMLNAQHIRRLS